jgi:diguanylate cyclase (GGDEF)-like protein/PAS domain S-box-containing protein
MSHSIRRRTLAKARRRKGADRILCAFAPLRELIAVDSFLKHHDLALWPLIEASSDGVVLVAADAWRVVIANSKLSEWFGTTPEQLIGRALDTFFDETSKDLVLEKLQQLIAGKVSDDFESVRLAQTDGGSRQVTARFCRVGDASAALAGVVLRDAAVAVDAASRFEPLTGLPDRTFLHARLTELLDRRPPGQDFAVLFVDINNFKEINDRHGHLVGDRVLREAAGHLRECLVSACCAVRYGGDEFVVLVESATPERVESLLVAIKAAMSRPIAVPGGEVSLSVSVGVAMGPAEFLTPEEVIAAADRAMYAAKRQGS